MSAAVGTDGSSESGSGSSSSLGPMQLFEDGAKIWIGDNCAQQWAGLHMHPHGIGKGEGTGMGVGIDMGTIGICEAAAGGWSYYHYANNNTRTGLAKAEHSPSCGRCEGLQ